MLKKIMLSIAGGLIWAGYVLLHRQLKLSPLKSVLALSVRPVLSEPHAITSYPLSLRQMDTLSVTRPLLGLFDAKSARQLAVFPQIQPVDWQGWRTSSGEPVHTGHTYYHNFTAI